jgi:hypothetical protein
VPDCLTDTCFHALTFFFYLLCSETNEIRESFEREFLNSTTQHDNTSVASSGSFSTRDDLNIELANETVTSTRAWQTVNSRLDDTPVKTTKKRVVKKPLIATNEVTSKLTVNYHQPHILYIKNFMGYM